MSQAKTLFGRKPAPVMASFSSRGPNQVQPYILNVLLYTWICYIFVICWCVKCEQHISEKTLTSKW